MTTDAVAPAPPSAPRPVGSLLTAPIMPALVRFALPNMAAMLATALATVAETAYVGSFGVPSLAGMALVFPMVMLQMMLSGGAMGGGVSSAVSRALGAGCWRRRAGECAGGARDVDWPGRRRADVAADAELRSGAVCRPGWPR